MGETIFDKFTRANYHLALANIESNNRYFCLFIMSILKINKTHLQNWTKCGKVLFIKFKRIKVSLRPKKKIDEKFLFTLSYKLINFTNLLFNYKMHKMNKVCIIFLNIL